MTRKKRIEKLRHLITCMKCQVSGKCCDDNCSTQYAAGNMGEIIENLEEIAKALEQEPCADAISREAVLEIVERVLSKGDALFEIEQLPSVTPQLKTGHWITLKDEYGDVHEAICSNCDRNGNHKWAFCPYCGQPKMQEVENDS